MFPLATWIRWLVVSAVCVLAVHVASAHAAQTSDASPVEPYAALLSQSYMPLPSDYTIVPSPGGCPGQVSPGMSRPAACADSSLKVFIDPRILDPTSNGTTVLTHELGHIVDFTIRARDGGALDAAFDALMADTPGYRLEQFADVWAECSIYGPTADTEVITPVYFFHIPAATYASACEAMRAATESFGPAPATYSGAPWRMQAQPGDCMSGRYVVACTQAPVAKAAKRLRRCKTYRRHHRPARCRKAHR